MIGPEPNTFTEKTAVCPAFNVSLTGCFAITGGTGKTCRKAGLLVSFPAALLTMHRKLAPLSARVGAVRVYKAAVAPLMSESFFCHWKFRGAVPEAAMEK